MEAYFEGQGPITVFFDISVLLVDKAVHAGSRRCGAKSRQIDHSLYLEDAVMVHSEAHKGLQWNLHLAGLLTPFPVQNLLEGHRLLGEDRGGCDDALDLVVELGMLPNQTIGTVFFNGDDNLWL